MTNVKDKKKHVVASAMKTADDVAAGRLDPNDIEAAAVEACRQLFGVVHGPDDPLWDLHGDVCRQYLSLEGMPADEIAEWLAVQRQREGKPVVEPEVSWIERALALGDGEDDETEVEQPTREGSAP